MDLPIKLLIVMIIITISIPILTGALEDNQERMADSEMHQEASKLKNSAMLAHYSGNGSTRTVDIDLPAGCEIMIGGEGSDAYSIRSLYKGKLTSTVYFEKPILKINTEMTLSGRMSLILKSIEADSASEIEVAVL